MPTKITDTNISSTGVVAGSYTNTNITVNESGQITSASSSSVSPRITNIQIANSSYLAIDDTAVSTSGGYIIITGSGFTSGCQVVIGTLVATSISFINSTTIHAQVPAQSSGTYTVYLTNTDGSVAIRVNGLNYSATPSWQTTSPLTSGVINTPISLQLQATSNTSVVYQLQTGSTLPSGLTLSSSGLLTGTVTGLTTNTTYNFTVVAIDQENQDTPQAFSITIQIMDPYFEYTTLLLPGNGTNGAQNNTFLDASTNNFTITRNGNTTQGSFSPFSQSGWSNYLPDQNVNNVNFTSGASSNFQFTGDFTVEVWVYPDNNSGDGSAFVVSDNANYLAFNLSISANVFNIYLNNSTPSSFTADVPLARWSHLAMVRSGSATNNIKVYVDGQLKGQLTNTSTLGYINPSICRIGGGVAGINRYYSNLRVCKSAVYTTTFTPSTTPLTSTSQGATNCVLLTAQSNRFVNNVAGATVTISGSPSVQAFSPFNPTASWSAATYGGSGYFDGSGDYLTVANNSAFDFGSGDFTLEAWLYPITLTNHTIFTKRATEAVYSPFTFGLSASLFPGFNASFTGSSWAIMMTSTVACTLNVWNHLSLTRSGSNFTIWVNGISGATATGASALMTNTSPVVIAAGAADGASPAVGYISNARIVKGTAVYTSNFTPPTAPLTNITNTSLLLNFTNAGIYDATSRNVLETVGDAKISTTQSKWGGSSMYFDGTGDWLKSPANIFIEGTEAFTVECWMNLSNVSSTKGIIVGLGSNSFGLRVGQSYLGNVNGLNIVKSGVGDLDYCSFTFATSTWYHIAVCRSGTTIYFFVNGQQQTTQGSGAGSFSFTKPTSFYVGCNNDTNENFAGYMQDLRITKGYARYTSNFTVPTAAFQTQ